MHVIFEDSLRALAGLPGYFWCIESQKLFSIKKGGVLQELHITPPNQYNNYIESMYRVSVKGRRKVFAPSQLKAKILPKFVVKVDQFALDPDPSKREWEYDGQGRKVWNGTRIEYDSSHE